MGPQFLEIITWNDYGESHYIGPLSSIHYDDGNSKWTNDMQVLTEGPKIKYLTNTGLMTDGSTWPSHS